LGGLPGFGGAVVGVVRVVVGAARVVGVAPVVGVVRAVVGVFVVVRVRRRRVVVPPLKPLLDVPWLKVDTGTEPGAGGGVAGTTFWTIGVPSGSRAFTWTGGFSMMPPRVGSASGNGTIGLPARRKLM
jgi:hypothetical protein